ncbi:hypothetical protein [Asticcacaulis excentricus]|nr:hypothetical protein [Asticcacaulis excentricus]
MRPRYSGYHLKAERASCALLIDRITVWDFTKVSFSLQPVPQEMPLILASEGVKFEPFDKWRLRRDETIQGFWQSERNGVMLDTALNSKGIERLSEAFTYMLDGEWDYRVEDMSFWGEPHN